jgi:hypothetical protein
MVTKIKMKIDSDNRYPVYCLLKHSDYGREVMIDTKLVARVHAAEEEYTKVQRILGRLEAKSTGERKYN